MLAQTGQNQSVDVTLASTVVQLGTILGLKIKCMKFLKIDRKGWKDHIGQIFMVCLKDYDKRNRRSSDGRSYFDILS